MVFKQMFKEDRGDVVEMEQGTEHVQLQGFFSPFSFQVSGTGEDMMIIEVEVTYIP